jgi:glutamate dehydrogenase (NAD(P)+)
MANMPTTPAALEILHARGVTVVPDFIANAGGVIAAAHSMDARYSPFTVDPEHVFAMISTKMRQNTITVVTEARNRHLTTHAAAQRLSQERVRDAMMLRGQIPPEGGDHR